MSDLLIGIDIGGTKCAVVLGNNVPEILDRVEIPTDSETGPEQTINKIENIIQNMLDRPDGNRVKYIGISCGGPLDSKRGIILSPPNLPGWDNISIVSRLKKKFGIPVALQNDANACALAEWKWGAGKGCRNMIFLTFGTGLGAGLILDGRLYFYPLPDIFGTCGSGCDSEGSSYSCLDGLYCSSCFPWQEYY